MRGERARLCLVCLVCLVLVAAVLAVYLQVGGHEFISYDDPDYVTRNSQVAKGLGAGTVAWAFGSVEAANWHPVTWLSHLADVSLFGMAPRGHHLTSVALHAGAALLLLFALLRLTGSLWGSAFVAALFALHPMHVESVAWVAERKDVLSAFFFFLTLLMYAEYVRRGSRAWYLLALGAFVLGLMSKPMLVTLPLVLLLLDYWPLGRFRTEGGRPVLKGGEGSLSRLVAEKLPFFACSLGSGLMTLYAQQHAMSTLAYVQLSSRVYNAWIAYLKYLAKAFWPSDLGLLYPLPPGYPYWQSYGSLVLLVAASAAVFYLGRRRPYLTVGWLWFLVTLLPVIGIVQVGSQAMADRYSYLPLVGIFIMVAWGSADLAAGLRHRVPILAVAGSAACLACAVLAWQQAGYWRDSATLYRHTLEVTGENPHMHNNLGLALADRGQLDQAIAEFQSAIELSPGHAMAHMNLGNVLAKKGELDQAITYYRASLRINPDDADAHNNLAIALARKGDLDAALAEFGAALRISPGHVKARKGLELAQRLKGQGGGAGR